MVYLSDQLVIDKCIRATPISEYAAPFSGRQPSESTTMVSEVVV